MLPFSLHTVDLYVVLLHLNLNLSIQPYSFIESITWRSHRRKNQKKTQWKTPVDPTQQRSIKRQSRGLRKTSNLSDRETDLSKTNPRLWWEQISEYKDLTYQKKLEELLEHGTDSIDPHTTYHI